MAILGIRSAVEREAVRAFGRNSHQFALSPKGFSRALEMARVGDSERVLAKHVELVSSRLHYPGSQPKFDYDTLAIRQARDALDQLSTIEMIPATTRLAALETASKLTDGPSSLMGFMIKGHDSKITESMRAAEIQIRGFGAGGTEHRIATLRRQAAEEQRILADTRKELGDGYVDQSRRASAHV